MTLRTFVDSSARFGAALLLLLPLVGCEAPLNLAHVAEEQAKSTHGFDHFKAIAANDTRIVAASDAGILLTTDKATLDWQRIQLPTRASFINLASCPDGSFVAIDSRHTLWVADAQGTAWQGKPVDTEESLMGLGCDQEGKIWLGASFSTLLVSKDAGDTWTSSTRDEDLQFTAIQFTGDSLGVAAGEFGTVMITEDFGQNWEPTELLPNEFYPMGVYFRDRQHGWVSGLGGTVLHTADGGASWSRQHAEASTPLYNFAALGDRLFALGDNGTLLELKGDRWAAVSVEGQTTSYLIGAVPAGGQQLVVAGGAGTLRTLDLIPDAGRVAGPGGKL